MVLGNKRCDDLLRVSILEWAHHSVNPHLNTENSPLYTSATNPNVEKIVLVSKEYEGGAIMIDVTLVRAHAVRLGTRKKAKNKKLWGEVRLN